MFQKRQNATKSMRLCELAVYLFLVLSCSTSRCTAGHDDSEEVYDEDTADVTPAPPSSSPPPPPSSEEPLPLCPPKPPVESVKALTDVLLVSTLDGQLSALDLSNEGEMVWSVTLHPGTMLDSTISSMDLDPRGYFVKLIPSLTGRLYKFDGEVVEQIPMDVDSLLGSSQKMQENIVITGGKETRTYGIHALTGEIMYECSMNECNKFKETSTEDMFVVQCSTKTVRAHTPKNGDQKWNFSVSLHDISFYPGQDPCEEEDQGTGGEVEEEGDHIKTVVPEGIICATREDQSLKWTRKFQAPIVDVWRLRADKLSKVDLFSKNHIPRRDILLDDSVADENPSLYIGRHNNQLYIQESINLLMGSMLPEASDENKQVDFPRVSWKPYMVSASRTPIINLGPGGHPNLIAPAYDPVIQREDSKVTALALTSGNTEYPFDSGFYLYSDAGASLDPEDPVANVTGLQEAGSGQPGKGSTGGKQETEEEETTVELIYMSLWHWWKEVLLIAVVTAIMTNILITQPIVHNLRYDFQDWSRQLVEHVETMQRERNAQQVVREVMVEVPVPSLTNNTGSTPSTTGTIANSGPDFSGLMRQGSDFQSRFQSDFQPLQCLGKGGFGIVFECKNKYDDVHYAVKRITLPRSEDDKKKVMREVKLHAKLDHKHIVRFFTTWMEEPPPGWQKEADSWFSDEDLGSGGPTQLDPTETEYSATQSKVDEKKDKKKNPFYQYSISTGDSSSNQFGTSSPSSDNSLYYQRTWDDSFSVNFEYSNCDNNNAASRDRDSVHQNGATNFPSFSAAPPNDKIGGKSSVPRATAAGDDELSTLSYDNSGDYLKHFDDTTSGGIHFEVPSDDGEGKKRKNREVSLDLEDTDFWVEQSSVNSDCCDALEWDSKEKGSKDKDKDRKDEVKASPQKSLSYLYIVMQLCKKETLRDWLRNTKQRNQNEILTFFHQICVGVEYVHRQGLIHRDLKPSNIYFSHDGVVKIGDFGLVTGGALAAEPVNGEAQEGPEDAAGTSRFELNSQLTDKMERFHIFTAAKKQIFPEDISSNPDFKNLLTSMLNSKPEMRPEAENILELEWLQEYKESSSWKRKRLESTGSELGKND